MQSDFPAGTIVPSSISNPLVTVIFNPNAGQAPNLQAALERSIQQWRNAGWQVELRPTQQAGHGTDLARAAAAAGHAMVVAVGGDGTVNEVMNGLVGTETALGMLPGGTVNVWAREMGLPMDLEKAATMLLKADRRSIDVGRVRSIVSRRYFLPRRRQRKGVIIDRYFLLMASIGFDAAVTATVNLQEKKTWGAMAYLKQSLQLLSQYRVPKLTLYLDGRRVRGRVLMAVVGNSQLYGGALKFTHQALVDDGLLDICIIRGRSMLKAPLRLWSIVTRRHAHDERIDYYQAQQVKFLCRRPVPVQIDGDYLGTTPLRLDIVPKGLWVMVPPGADRSLFTHPLSTPYL
jgi:diacylglycerol kinase (ATP)